MDSLNQVFRFWTILDSYLDLSRETAAAYSRFRVTATRGIAAAIEIGI
jgi:hypothetical protein